MPYLKLLAIRDHAQNLEKQQWMEGRREVSIISQRPATSSDLKQDRSVFRGSISTFVQLVAAMYRVTLKSICSEQSCKIGDDFG